MSLNTNLDNSNIFLMPGLDGTGELFAPIQPLLVEDAVVVQYKDECEFNDYVESVAALLPSEDAILIAESFSGPIALALMAKYPGRIKCAVLSAAFAVSPFKAYIWLSQFFPSQFFGPYPMQESVVKAFCFDSESDPELMSKTLSVIQSIPAKTIKSRLKLLADLDIRPLLSSIATPVLYLQALQDKIVGPDLSQQLVQGLPNVTMREVNGPHLLLQTRPDKCAALIKPFIDSGFELFCPEAW